MKPIKIFLAFAAAFSAIALLVGCGGDTPFDPAVVTGGGSSFVILPIAGQLAPPFGTADFPITVKKVFTSGASRSEGDVHLSVTGLPSGSSATFSVNPVTPTTSGATVTMHVDLDSGGSRPHPIRSGAPVNYTLTITGDDGTTQKTETATLSVGFPPDFSIGVLEDSVSVNPGATANYTVTIGAVHASTLPVTLSLTGEPAGSQVSFSTNPVVPGSPAQSIMHVKVPGTLSPGRGLAGFTLTISGTDGTNTHTVQTQLIILSGG